MENFEMMILNNLGSVNKNYSVMDRQVMFSMLKSRQNNSLKSFPCKPINISELYPSEFVVQEDMLKDFLMDQPKKIYDRKIPMKTFNNIKEENKMGSLVEVKEKMIEDAEYTWVDGYMTIDLEYLKKEEFASGKIFVFANRPYADYGSQFYRRPTDMKYEQIPFKSLFGYCDQLMIMKVKALVSRVEPAPRSAYDDYPALENAPKEFEIEEIIPTERISKFIESHVIFGNDDEKFKFFEIGENDIREGLTYRFTKMINGFFKFKSEESSRLFVKNILLNDSSTNEYIKCLENKIERDHKLTPGSIDIMHCIDANLEKMYFVISMLHSEQFDTKEMISFMKDYKIN